MNPTARLALYATLSGAALLAQIQPGQLPPKQPDDANVSSSAPEPLTTREKYRLALKRSLDPVELVRISAGAAYNQARNYPSEWGQGWDAFGVRMASGFGQQLVKEQIAFGVWAIDHEDPRHRRSGLRGFWPRTRYAVLHTFIADRDGGGSMPAYSRFLGDYGAGYVSREWYPTRFHNFQQGFDAGSISLAFDIGTNVLREFIPSRLVP